MALDVTIGGVSSDSYNTVTEFQAYVADYLGADLSAKAPGELEPPLRRAVQLMHMWYSWLGLKASAAQALDFPRSGIPGENSRTIPVNVKRGQLEIAHQIVLGVDFTPVLASGAIKKTKVKAGPVETDTEYQGASLVPRIAILSGLLSAYTSSGRFGAVRKVRG